MNIFIYRPDKRPNPNVNPDLCYTLDGRNFHDWKNLQNELYNYKIELIKNKLKNKTPKHQVLDYWR